MTGGLTIPASIDEVTPAWLAEATGFDVAKAEPQQIGVGIGVSSALYRVALGGGPGCPETVVVKLPALDEAAVFTSTVLRMYVREVGFFEHLAARSPIRVPGYHYGAVDPDASRFVVVMEDMSSMRVVDQLLGMELADAERAVDGLAAWHAEWWGEADKMAADGLTISLGDPIYPAILPMVFAEGWAKVSAGMELAPAITTVGPRFSDAIAGLLSDLASGPTTLAHGDYRADNLLFDAGGSVCALDFQLIGTGTAAYDLAYFLTQSLAPDVAAANEQKLFDRWTAGLVAGGVPESDLAQQWDMYRKAALFCLVYPVVASRGMDLADPRQYELLDCMNTRFARAVEQLDLVSLL
ncbi:MAG: hypothetical protein QOF60_2246 [Actinomycetota bacterium]|jgi:hypothetical protein|nr:hypothetical protein [Actinomycetota bacterium]